MNHFATLAAIASLGTMSVTAVAQVVYSHFIGATPITQLPMPGWEFADYITLAGGPAVVQRLELKIGAFEGTGSQGTLIVRLYGGDPGGPGALIAFFTQPVTLVAVGPQVVTFDFGGRNFPAAAWISVLYTRTSGSSAGVIIEGGAPTVGSVSAVRAFRVPNSLSWTMFSSTSSLTMEVTAVPSCFANCDGSTTAPILNVSDFICFQTKYAAGDPYANCDRSTIPPVLNVTDFVCFQTAYAAGCS